MPRKLRIDVPGFSQHIIQRGVNRAACFCDDHDHQFYQVSLGESVRKNCCRIHAYVLMSNHVHLLVTGGEAGCISSMMQNLGRRYVRYFNTRHDRTGTLWEGRFKSSLIDSEQYLLACYRYIEMNPVRSGMVSRPQDYRWSSVHANAYGQWDVRVDPHSVYLQLGSDVAKRLASYRHFLEEDIGQGEVDSIRDHVNQGKVLGSSKFQEHLGVLTGLNVKLAPMGRPRKQRSANAVEQS